MRRLLVLMLLCGAASGAQATYILWEQLPATDTMSWIDQEFPDLQAASTYQVHDVVVGAGGWKISSITGYYTKLNDLWPSSLSVRLNVFSKSGSLPTAGDDPVLGSVWTAALTRDMQSSQVTLTGLDLVLPTGSYWIGMTPILDFGNYDQEWHQLSAAVVGDASALRNPGGYFGFGSDWKDYTAFGELYGDLAQPGDGAIKIEGTTSDVPEPGTSALTGVILAGALAGAFRSRRR